MTTIDEPPIPDWLKSMITGVRADKRKPKLPFYRQCAERAYYTMLFPECACATCKAATRSRCKYVVARRNRSVVYHGPDFRPFCVWGMSFRASRSTRPMRRCGIPDMDCYSCMGVMPLEPWIAKTIFKQPNISDTNVVAAVLEGVEE